MNLSSLRRLRLYCGGSQADPIQDKVQNNRMLAQWLGSVSAQVETFLGRFLKLDTYTEFFDITYNKGEFWLKGRPIVNGTDGIVSVFTDPTGLWNGTEAQYYYTYAGRDNSSVCFPMPLTWQAKKGCRIIYQGGLAAHAVNSTFTVTAGTFTAANYVTNQSKTALGVVVSQDGLFIVIENIYGVFEIGDTLSVCATEEGTYTNQGAISAITAQSLAEVAPNLVVAVEAQVRHMWKYGLAFETQSYNKEGNTFVPRSDYLGTPFIKEVYDMLHPYRAFAE